MVVMGSAANVSQTSVPALLLPSISASAADREEFQVYDCRILYLSLLSACFK